MPIGQLATGRNYAVVITSEAWPSSVAIVAVRAQPVTETILLFDGPSSAYSRAAARIVCTVTSPGIDVGSTKMLCVAPSRMVNVAS